MGIEIDSIIEENVRVDRLPVVYVSDVPLDEATHADIEVAFTRLINSVRQLRSELFQAELDLTELREDREFYRSAAVDRDVLAADVLRLTTERDAAVLELDRLKAELADPEERNPR